MSKKMREILFRGKRTDNGAWVEGAFCLKDCDDPFGDTVDRPSIIKYDPPFDGFWFRVDPETVGQFTGLTDKNGKKIFEGDILDYWSDIRKSFCKNYETVVYGVENCGCCYSVYGWSSKDRYGYGDYIGHPESCVVVGNIHDNPELLEEATNV